MTLIYQIGNGLRLIGKYQLKLGYYISVASFAAVLLGIPLVLLATQFYHVDSVTAWGYWKDTRLGVLAGIFVGFYQYGFFLHKFLQLPRADDYALWCAFAVPFVLGAVLVLRKLAR